MARLPALPPECFGNVVSEGCSGGNGGAHPLRSVGESRRAATGGTGRGGGGGFPGASERRLRGDGALQERGNRAADG